ncbi:MAG TPA: phosphatase domain-containing protein [Thermoanaerobaculia bacterium]|nr:phosphatase domain-containing protein [Thermoanaerobaculia bacterium]
MSTSIFKRAFLRAAVPVERGVDALKGRIASRFDRDDPLQILPYRGFGTPQKFLIQGRVLQDEPVGAAGENDTIWKNLGNTWKRFESDEVPHARLLVRGPGWERELAADEEGYFQEHIEPAVPLDPGRWHEVEFDLLHPETGVNATGPVLIPPDDAEFGVISDIDDTVLETGVTRKLAMARTVFLNNARTRLPFKGVAAFYDALVQGVNSGGENPIFFVSGSPWNLYDLLAEFMDLQKIPRGPILLRDFGLDLRKLIKKETVSYKLDCIRPILDFYPKLRFILIGDSGEKDPEIYRQVVKEYPGRILAIYIRKIGVGPFRDQQVLDMAKEIREEGVPMLLCEDTEAAAVHARESGWIRPEEVQHVQEEKAKDEVAPSPTEVALTADPKPDPKADPPGVETPG